MSPYRGVLMTDPQNNQPDRPDQPDRAVAGGDEPGRDAKGPSANPILAMGRFRSDQLSATVISYLITGPAVFGGLGYLADRWLGTSFLLLIGMLGGMAMSLYVIWLRYGTP